MYVWSDEMGLCSRVKGTMKPRDAGAGEGDHEASILESIARR